jgi:NAD(P)-dependent dehydrogenase (short-subunit alcohol dehydrogenase family)
MGETTKPGAVAITGASTGIGRGTALYLAGKGVRVFAGVRKAADGEALAAEGGERLVPWLIDVADGASIDRAVARLEEGLDGAALAGLVNNAGIALGGPQEFLGLDQWRHQFEVNVFGLVDLTQKVLPLLVRSRGRVVNVSSIGGRVATPMMGPYCASKFAVEGLTAALRHELHGSGVWAATIEPGMVKTEIWAKGDAQIAEQKALLPAAAQERYAGLVRSLERFSAAGKTKGVAPVKVAHAIEHALFAARPRTRYPVGSDARMLTVLQWLLPERAFEWLLRRAM